MNKLETLKRTYEQFSDTKGELNLLSFSEVLCAFDEFQFVAGGVESIAMRVTKRGNVSYYSVGTQINLHCSHPEAELEGFSNLRCTPKGQWDHEIPICHQLPCSQLPQ